jgi:uncharacterized protein YnzC (UPF0291/DUF896 family)
MDLKEVIAQLNAIYHKSQQTDLTAAQLAERDRLRGIYLEAMKQQVRTSLDAIKVADPGPSDPKKTPRNHDCDCGRPHH